MGATACELDLDVCHFDEAEQDSVESNLDEHAFMRLTRGSGDCLVR